MHGGLAGAPIRAEAYRITATLFRLHNAGMSLSRPCGKELQGLCVLCRVLFLNAHHFISKHFFKHAIDTILP